MSTFSDDKTVASGCNAKTMSSLRVEATSVLPLLASNFLVCSLTTSIKRDREARTAPTGGRMIPETTAKATLHRCKYKGRVVLRGDIVKDNSGSYAVFTEQGSSASQMTAAKIMDIISRLPGCDEVADALSAYTQVKWKMHPTDIWIRLPRHKWPKSWSSMEDPVVPLERNLYGHPLAGLLWEKAIRENPIETWLGENSKLGMSWCIVIGLFLSVYVDDIKMAGKKQDIEPVWQILMEEVDLGNPTSFLDHVYLGCLQRESQKSKDILWTITKTCSNPGFLRGRKKNYRPELHGNLMQTQDLLGPMTWKVMQRNAWTDIVN